MWLSMKMVDLKWYCGRIVVVSVLVVCLSIICLFVVVDCGLVN